MIEIVEFATLYEIGLLVTLVQTTLEGSTSEENAIERFSFAHSLPLHALRRACGEIIRRALRSIRNTKGFKELSFRMLDEILMCKGHLVLTQVDVLRAIATWARGGAASNDFPKESPSPWKIAESRRLRRHVDCSKLEYPDLSDLDYDVLGPYIRVRIAMANLAEFPCKIRKYFFSFAAAETKLTRAIKSQIKASS